MRSSRGTKESCPEVPEEKRTRQPAASIAVSQSAVERSPEESRSTRMPEICAIQSVMPR